jgi:hypothetical protein
MLQLAKPAPIRSVHLQQANRSSAYRSACDDDDSVALKVLIPLVLARMKQPDECAAFRVKPAQVRPLVGIAVVTGQVSWPIFWRFGTSKKERQRYCYLVVIWF